MQHKGHVKEYQDKAAERGTKTNEFEPRGNDRTDAGSSREGKRIQQGGQTRGRQVAKHLEDPEGLDGKVDEDEGKTSERTVEEGEESMLRKNCEVLEDVGEQEAKKESEETQEVVEWAEVETDEEGG